MPTLGRLLASICLIAITASAAAQPITLQPVLSDLSSPIFASSAEDGSRRLFIVERGGVIKVRQPASSTTTTFLDISEIVLAGGERGLLGLAFHPEYELNGRFFVNYTRQPDGATVIAEYRASANPDIASTAERQLLTVAQPYDNHNGGMLAFGPDGYLYIGMGDGGSGNDPGNRAQNVNDLLGKLLRIDVDSSTPNAAYTSPSTNPYATSAGRDEIWATGLRNPWRFSFDRNTGDLYIADVGQGLWEEINLQPASSTGGENYGWRVYEADQCTNLDPCTSAGKTFPIVEYGHTNGRCSITGGYAYRGASGAVTAGAYIYGDFCSGEIFKRDPDGTVTTLLDTTIRISSFGEDEDGEVYVVGLGGTVHRITGSLGSAPEIGRLGHPSVGAGATLRLQVTATDADGHAVTFGAPGLPQGATFDAATGVFRWRPSTSQIGSHDVTFSARDSRGLESTARVRIVVHPTVAPPDFNADGTHDAVLRHSETGDIGVWLMNGFTLEGGGLVGNARDVEVAATGDFDGDGRSDLLLRDMFGGIGLWIMNGTALTRGTYLTSAGSSVVAGAGDFDGDGLDDILLRDRAGSLGVLRTNGSTITSGQLIGSLGSYEVVAIADFNADLRDDILLRDINGNLGMWLMNGALIASGHFVGSPAGYALMSAADYDGDGRADLLLRDVNGTLGLWFMNGPAIASARSLGTPHGQEFANSGNYDGAPEADMLLRNRATGEVSMWNFNRGTASGPPRPVAAAPLVYDVQ